MDHLCYLCLVFVMLLRMFIAVLWSHAGKGLISCLSFVMFNCVFVTFPYRYGILGHHQVWYSIVLFHDLTLIFYVNHLLASDSYDMLSLTFPDNSPF